MPIGGLPGAEGAALATRLVNGENLVGTLFTTSVIENRYSSNVIATTKMGDKNNIVFAGAHSDSVAAGPVRFFSSIHTLRVANAIFIGHQ